MTRITSKDQWPKAFYDNGGGSFGFTPSNKLQSGVLSADLQVGNGVLISGSTGQIIIGGGGNQIIFGINGVSGLSTGGPIFNETALIEGGDVVAAGAVVPASFGSIQILHGLGYTPAFTCYTQDYKQQTTGGLFDGLTGFMRPFNNLKPSSSVLDETYVGYDTTSYSDLSIYPVYQAGGGGTGWWNAGCYVEAVATNLLVEISATWFGTGTTGPGAPHPTFTSPDRPTQVFIFSDPIG